MPYQAHRKRSQYSITRLSQVLSDSDRYHTYYLSILFCEALNSVISLVFKAPELSAATGAAPVTTGEFMGYLAIHTTQRSCMMMRLC